MSDGCRRWFMIAIISMDIATAVISVFSLGVITGRLIQRPHDQQTTEEVSK